MTLDKQTLASLSFAALGVVYGDIGTSPLYAMREALDNLPINLINVLGILSLIFWSLILVIAIKYFSLVLRADNNGEGGILALLALIRNQSNRHLKFFFVAAIFGAGLMLGDGMLTPSISVISAVEGLSVVTPHLSNWIVPIASIILLALFFFQSYGTEKIGFAFAPLITLWFIVIALLGLHAIILHPIVLMAINPYYAIHFFIINGWHGYILLGSVFLVLTGGEALYADLGHFGKNPIRLSWFCVVLPSLVLNYFGQAGNLLQHPDAIQNPFYFLSPNWFQIPLMIIAMLATIIASQAVISATFSLAKQAVLLGLYPMLTIKQTSETEKGQIYIPQMNIILAIGTLLLTITFKTSSNLAHAYGIAVNCVMALTTFMVGYCAYKVWHWPRFIVIPVFGFFLFIELAFFGANIEKIITGGWVPLLFAFACAFIMYTWNKGMRYVKESYYEKQINLTNVIKTLRDGDKQVIPDMTNIFITDMYDTNGNGFLHYLQLNHQLPENILIIHYDIANIPYVKSAERFTVSCIDQNICQLTLHYGFMDHISIPQSLYLANERKILPFSLQIQSTTYYIEVTHVVPSIHKKTLWFVWQEKLFAFLMRNYASNLNIEFYKLPYDRTIAIGGYCII